MSIVTLDANHLGDAARRLSDLRPSDAVVLRGLPMFVPPENLEVLGTTFLILSRLRPHVVLCSSCGRAVLLAFAVPPERRWMRPGLLVECHLLDRLPTRDAIAELLSLRRWDYSTEELERLGLVRTPDGALADLRRRARVLRAMLYGVGLPRLISQIEDVADLIERGAAAEALRTISSAIDELVREGVWPDLTAAAEDLENRLIDLVLVRRAIDAAKEQNNADV